MILSYASRLNRFTWHIEYYLRNHDFFSLLSVWTRTFLHSVSVFFREFLSLFFFVLALQCGWWDLSSPMRDRTQALGHESMEF